ncbi:hypothetical protein WJX79_000802 [Trebouxia sp. C0005]
MKNGFFLKKTSTLVLGCSSPELANRCLLCDYHIPPPFVQDKVTDMESTAAIQARDGLLGGNVTGQPGWDRLCTQGNQQNACSILVVKTQADESFPLLSEPRRVLMLPEPHLFNFIKTHSVHNTASGWGATLSDSPPTAPGTPDFADYVKDNRLHSSCIDNNFCSAVTQSSQRHAQPQRSTQPYPLQFGTPSRMKAPSVIAASNTNRQQHSSMSPPAQSTTRSLLAGQRQACRSHASRRYNRAAPLNLPKVPEDTAFLLSPNGTQQSEHPSLELNMVPQVRILRRPTCSAHAEPVIMAGSTAEVPLAQVPQQSVQRKAPCCVCVEPVVRPGNRAEAAQVPQQSSSRVSVHHAAAEPVGMPGNLAAVPPTQVLPLRILQRPSHVSVVKPVLMSSNNAESPQAQAQNLSAPHVRGTSCVIQRTRGLIEELWFGGFKIAAPKSITSAAITIQTALRGHLCRQRLQGLRAAAVKIQACWRAWFCRRNFLLMKTLAALVQPGFKGRLLRRSAIEAVTALQGYDNTRRMLTLVAQQRRQNSLNLALHPKGDADRAHEEVQVVTHPQDTQEVEAGMEAELTYAVQEAPDRILPATLEDVPIDAEDGQATGAAERDLSLAAQQAATAASASPEDMFDTQAWLREEYEATFSTSVDPVRSRAAKNVILVFSIRFQGISGVSTDSSSTLLWQRGGIVGGRAAYRSIISLLGQHFVWQPPDTGHKLFRLQARND